MKVRQDKLRSHEWKKRVYVLKIRVNEDELAAVRRAANAGQAGVSKWIRRVIVAVSGPASAI